MMTCSRGGVITQWSEHSIEDYQCPPHPSPTASIPTAPSLGRKSNQSEFGAAAAFTQALPVGRRAHPAKHQALLSLPALTSNETARQVAGHTLPGADSQNSSTSSAAFATAPISP
jgi:hypothetical protein